MNIRELLNMQKELDKLILNKAGIAVYPLRKVKLALLTELGELANEVQSFKYWKSNKKIDRNKVTEEWADCLHFALSIENAVGEESDFVLDNLELATSFDKGIFTTDIDMAFEITYRNVVLGQSILLSILTLGRCLNLSKDEMELAYLNKNKENYRRQREDY